MNILFFAHPTYLGSESMPRFTCMLMDGMKKRGWNVSLLQPSAFLSRLPAPRFIKKWLGYFDQFIAFPIMAKAKLKQCSADTVFVFTDHALGPWVPLVARRPHVIHCHDFLAQRSAKGLIEENPTGWSGRCYQWYIRQGYRQGQNFICVSNKTQEDLHAFLLPKHANSSVVYNGMNRSLEPRDPTFSRAVLSKYTGLDLSDGYVLHVGGNQWYKNRKGVIEIYDEWRSFAQRPLPLLMIGKRPDKGLQQRYNNSPVKDDIHLVSGLEDELIPFAYSGAELLLFPSLAEGFGWPIAEAMACGCPVITTDARPMSEVTGGAAYLIPMFMDGTRNRSTFVRDGAMLIDQILALSPDERSKLVSAGLENVRRFHTENSLDAIERIYREVLQGFAGREPDLKDSVDRALHVMEETVR